MSKRLKLTAIVGVIASIILSVTLVPVQSAYAEKGNTEASLKKALYASAVYQCAKDYGGSSIFQQVAKGDKISSIFSEYDTYNYYIGTGYGLSSNGQISCRVAAEKLFGTSTISDTAVNSGILKGVYEYGTSSEKKISCDYGIINSQKSGLIQNNKTFYWPAGYYDGPNGHVNMTNHGRIWVVYDDTGPIRLEGATSDISPEHTLESMRQYLIDWKHDDKICSDLVQYTEVYSFQTQNLQGETITAYAPIRANTTDKVGGSWILNGGDVADAAWLNKASPAGFHHTVEAVTDNTKLLPTSDAGTQLAANVQQTYLDGSAGLSAFLADHPDARYLLYGRYLFNGDGGYSGGCAGAVVLDKDVDPAKMDTTYWDTSLSYVSTFSAWKNASTKETYRVKFGGNGIAAAGRDVDVVLPGQEYTDCSALITKFSSTTNSVSTTTPKTTVYKYMGVTDVDELPEENDPGTVPGGSVNTDDGDDDGVTPNCVTHAGALGWILCPVLKITGNAVQGIYDHIVSELLMVDADNFSDASSVHGGWEKLRDIANTLFVIAFLLVILSQITGFGISNYGIKKVLPRLIAVVVLVNVSFIICQLAIDVSNILGDELYKLFAGWASDVTSDPYTVGELVASIATALFGTGLTGAVAVIAGIAAVNTWEFWLPGLLVTLLVALISIFFFMIILGVRQAGIIILVILSPVAIIAYALPNTKSFFDRWKKMFTSLLVVYPVCGLLMGGGEYASAIMVSTSQGKGFFYILVAMLLNVVPFFLIPSIVRGSMNAMGSLGAKIAGFGQKFGRGLGGVMRNSEGFRNFQRDLDLHNADRTVRRLNDIESRRGRLSNGQRRRRSRALSRGIALQEEDMRAAADTRAFPSTRTAEGRAALAAMQAKISDDAMEARVAEEEAGYRNSSTMDVNSVSDLEAEHQRLIDALDANPNDSTSLAQMRAIQNLLMAQGDPGQEAIFQNYMRRAALGGDSSGLHAAARHIASNGKYMAKIKAEDKGLFSAVNHFKTGDFSHAGAGASAYYGAQGAGSYTAETLAAADVGAIDRLVGSIQAGAISGGELNKLVGLANEALSNPNIKLKADVRTQLENMVAAGYSAGGRITGVSSAGSTALSGASIETLNSMVQRIRNVNGGAAFTGAPTAAGPALDQYNEVQAMARNAERALRNPNTPHDAATVERLQDILMAARDMGVQDTSGVDFDKVDPAAIKIRGIERRTAPPVPHGWAANGTWIGGGTSGTPPTKQQEIAYQEWAKKAAEVEMWNKDHGF